MVVFVVVVKIEDGCCCFVIFVGDLGVWSSFFLVLFKVFIFGMSLI